MLGVNPTTNDQIRFTRQPQVPVLKISDQWPKESTELGSWLDRIYPQKPILPAERDRILKIDKWLSVSLITTVFRGAVESHS